MNVLRTQEQRDLSLETLGACLNLLQQASSDNETFSALLLITNHVRSQTFTAEDQRTVLEAAGLEFVSRLLSSQSWPLNCPPDYYNCVGLGILSAWTVEPAIAQHPAFADFLAVINEVISPECIFKTQSHPYSLAIYEQMCRDSEEILYNLTKHETSVDRLLQSGTLGLLLEYSQSSSCQNVIQVLESLSTVVRSRGEGCLNVNPEKLLDVIKLTVKKLDQNYDIREKAQCARILTSFLTGLSTVEVTVEMDWVRELVLVLKKLITTHLAPDDNQDVLGLVCALVNTVGPQVLSPQVSRGDEFLKAVVGRVAVEVYMQLDNIHDYNAYHRYPVLDRVYKLLSSIVQFLAEGHRVDSQTIILIYRKLVEISEIIMAFLFSVASQEIPFPKNHIVVLISVRTLAAMLAEITEDVTPRMLELLPFFNLLCQNDLVMDMENTAPPALTIKSMEADTCIESCNIAESEDVGFAPNLCSEHHKMDASSSELPDVSSSTVENCNHADPSQNTVDRFGRLTVSGPGVPEADNNSFKMPPPASSSLTAAVCLHTEEQQRDNDTVNKSNILRDKENIISQRSDISLSETSIKNFKAYQASVHSLKTKPRSAAPRKVSFTEEMLTVNDQVEPERWRPTPDDVLGYLLPVYMHLLDNPEVLDVMERCGTFETIVTFLKTSLSRLMDNESSGYPESSAINALSVIELVYTNYPLAAAKLACFKEFFEISILTLPKLRIKPHLPPLVCLKLLEVSLAACSIRMRDDRETPSLTQTKASLCQLFSAAIDYLSYFYEIQQHEGWQVFSLHIRKEFKDVWPMAEKSWTRCIAGLCQLVTLLELQEALAISPVLPELMSYLLSLDGLSASSRDVHKMIRSILSLIESAAEGSPDLRRLIFALGGQIIAKKFQLKKLERCLESFSKNSK